MEGQRIGAALRAVRVRRGWRQLDVAAAAGVSDSLVSRLERGHVDNVTFATLRRIGAVLDVRVDTVARWRGGDLDRLLNARHSALHDQVAGWLTRRHPGWLLAPEASFSIYGERGVVDLLAYQPVARAALVVELKTEIVDVNELLGTLDRKRRLAGRIAGERGWPVDVVGSLVIVTASRTNQRRIEAHQTVLRAALPADAPHLRAWLRNPTGRCDAFMTWRTPAGSPGLRSVRRVRAALPRDT